MKALTSVALSLAAALSLGFPFPVSAHGGGGGGGNFGGGGGGFHGGGGGGGFHGGGASFHSAAPSVRGPVTTFHAAGPAFHSSAAFHESGGSFRGGTREFNGPRNSVVRTNPGSVVQAPTFAFGGHNTSASGPRVVQRSNGGGFNRPNGGWDRNWDRIWHGRHYHWNNGAWVILNDGFYPYGDSYYAPSTDDAYPDMSYDYGDTPSNVGAPQPYPAPPAGSAAPDGTASIAAEVQESLASRGYYDGQVDGIVGDGTRSAIADFQKDNNLPITGYITRSLLKALGL